MEITAVMVKELRSQSGAGIMECKSALKETSGDLEAAVTFLRKKGLAKADKKAKIAKFDQMVKKYPKIPANIKGKKIKPSRKNIIAGN